LAALVDGDPQPSREEFVMANVFAPFGFAESHRLGAAPNYQLGAARRWILASNTTPIYFGDPVIQLSSGYIAQATPAGQVSGIFCGCEYTSKAAKRVVWSPWWPGVSGDAVTAGLGFDVVAKVIDDPLTVFRVQANGQLALGQIGMNATFTFGLVGTANSAAGVPLPNQMSGIGNVALDITQTPPAVTATLPFRILDFVRDPPGINGTDFLSPYGWAFVTFNNQDFKTLTGI
jgi:hypothetical protein